MDSQDHNSILFFFGLPKLDSCKLSLNKDLVSISRLEVSSDQMPKLKKKIKSNKGYEINLEGYWE